MVTQKPKTLLHALRSKDTPTPGNYSQAVVVDLGAGRLIYTAGQTGNIPPSFNADEPVTPGGIEPQTNQALRNIEAVIGEAGADVRHIIKTTVYLEDLTRDEAGFERAYKSFFEARGIQVLPARSKVGVSTVPSPTESTVVMIEAVAYLPTGIRL